MWTNNYNPEKGDWYIVLLNGKRMPMSWTSYNELQLN